MMFIKRFRKFRTKGTFGFIGVLFLLHCFQMHNSTKKENRGIKQRTEDICHRYKAPEKRTLSGFVLRRENHLLYYCDVPKCGSAFMNALLKEAFSCNDCYYKKVNMLYKRNKYTYVKQKIQNSTYSFMFVREPYGRLFATYENKLHCPNKLWQRLGTDVIRVVRKNATSLSKQFGHDVTFAELVEYVVILFEQDWRLNIHLAPMYTRCDPCLINFNFIGKLEEMTDNLIALTKMWRRNGIKVDFESSVDVKELELKHKRDMGPITQMFDTLSRSPGLSRYDLFQRLWSSYQIRGLILNEQKMPFREDLVNGIDNVMYELAVKEAIELSASNVAALINQRKEALIKAYRTVPMEIMLRLRNVLKTDCELFGYDDMPQTLFDRSTSINVIMANK
ncbi:carbohydrate sulfotransferase 11-like [Mercenaria mercenaria]|uniref:carbohydrate sulfotransferase 11-like n=1 Tax=Mercenaria mercenaria TaxID=6596 RepID=UPI00234F4493|nr:carbohydrate sulfotransferase 11-like [Mercenaria mercenaria]